MELQIRPTKYFSGIYNWDFGLQKVYENALKSIKALKLNVIIEMKLFYERQLQY
jgi:hypothetical protein